MKRSFIRWLAPIFLLLSLEAALARADENATEDEGRPPPAKQYLVASLAAMLIIYTVVVPSRKH